MVNYIIFEKIFNVLFNKLYPLKCTTLEYVDNKWYEPYFKKYIIDRKFCVIRIGKEKNIFKTQQYLLMDSNIVIYMI